jgi:hypothetical protein
MTATRTALRRTAWEELNMMDRAMSDSRVWTVRCADGSAHCAEPSPRMARGEADNLDGGYGAPALPCGPHTVDPPPARLWMVRCANGEWSATGRSVDHALRIVTLFDKPDFGSQCGPHTVDPPSDPGKALVGPLPAVWFHDGTRPYRHPEGFGLVRVVVDALPPRDTVDGGRWERCTDHRLACDCREAELNEERTEYSGMYWAARLAAAKLLAGHDTRGYNGDPCKCTGCELARAGELR